MDGWRKMKSDNSSGLRSRREKKWESFNQCAMIENEERVFKERLTIKEEEEEKRNPSHAHTSHCKKVK